jgi:hypothetical protein
MFKSSKVGILEFYNLEEMADDEVAAAASPLPEQSPEEQAPAVEPVKVYPTSPPSPLSSGRPWVGGQGPGCE